MEPSGGTIPADSGQPGPIIGPKPEDSQKENTAKFFGRSKFSRAQNTPTQDAMTPSTPIISSNPNTPQFFNEAMAANTTSTVLDRNPERKSNKKLMIIGGCVAIAVLIIAVAVFSFISNSTKTKSEAFAVYETVVRTGGTDGNIVEDRIESLSLIGDEYYLGESAKEKQKKFVESLEKSYDDLEKAYSKDDNMQEELEQQKAITLFLSKMMSRESYEEEIIAFYRSDGYDKTIEKIDNDFSLSTEDRYLSTINKALKVMFVSKIEEYHIYSESNCVSGDLLDSNCLRGEKGDIEEANRMQKRSMIAFRNMTTSGFSLALSKKIDGCLKDFKTKIEGRGNE